jgi:hypothetical protein
MGQRFDDVEEFDDRARPAMADDQWQGRRPAALLVNEVQVDTIDGGIVVREPVDRRLVPAPIEFIQPVRAKLLHIIKIGAVSPTTIIRHLVPGVFRDPGADAIEGLVRDVDAKRMNHARTSSFEFLISLILGTLDSKYFKLLSRRTMVLSGFYAKTHFSR